MQTDARTLVLRQATDADALALADLAALDSARPLTGPVIVAELDGALVAAIATGDGAVVADPFVPTAGIRRLLRLRATGSAQDQRPQPVVELVLGALAGAGVHLRRLQHR